MDEEEEEEEEEELEEVLLVVEAEMGMVFGAEVEDGDVVELLALVVDMLLMLSAHESACSE